jgi:uncharacterized cupin superfamily protein
MGEQTIEYGMLKGGEGEWEPFINAEGGISGEVRWIRDAVVEGRPLRVGIWRVLEGQLPTTVPRLFPGHETIHVLEGELTVEIPGQETMHLKPGDTAHWAEGIDSRWTFKMPFSKLFHIS